MSSEMFVVEKVEKSNIILNEDFEPQRMLNFHVKLTYQPCKDFKCNEIDNIAENFAQAMKRFFLENKVFLPIAKGE